MKWRILPPLLVAAVVAGVGAGVVSGQLFSETHNTGGAVTATSGEPLALYICEPVGSSGDPDCPGDDSGPDEIIFEGSERLFGGKVVPYIVRVRNIDDQSWDVTGIDVVITEQFDPGGSCDTLPTIEFRDIWVSGENDHTTAGGALPAMQREGSAQWYVVHVDPGEHDDTKLRVSLSPEAPAACAGNEWSISIDWTIGGH